MNSFLLLAGMLVLHLDFNTVQMKKESVIDCLQVASKAGYNAVLWEIENKVQWETCPECVHPEAFTKAEFREILAEADRLGLEPIPLMQTLGHAEYVLSTAKYKSWREQADNIACYCTSNPEVRAFQKRLLHEYLELFGPKVRHFHLGGDEAIVFGTCPTCQTRNKMDLYVEHLNAVSQELRERGIRPGVWSDLMLIAADWKRRKEIDLDEPEITKLPTSYTLWSWNYEYGYAPEATPKGKRPNLLDFTGRLQELGYSIVVCGASQSGYDTMFLPFYERHRDNLAACAELARQKNLLGLCCTSWSVHLYPKSLQYPLWEFAANRYLRPATRMEDDYEAAVRRQFGKLSPDTLNRLGVGGRIFVGFDARQRVFLKPALPAEPGFLDKCVKSETSGGPETVAKRVAALRAEVSSLEGAIKEVSALSERNGAVRLLVEASKLKYSFVAAVADLLENKSLMPLPVAATKALYDSYQTPTSASNSTALAWSVLDQAKDPKVDDH